MNGPWYSNKKDGTLESYLKKHNGYFSVPLFKGYKQYKLLWDEGYFIPKKSVIRIMYNSFRGDEHYSVIDEHSVEGICCGFHEGQPGIHNVKKLFHKNSLFEAQFLKRKIKCN